VPIVRIVLNVTYLNHQPQDYGNENLRPTGASAS